MNSKERWQKIKNDPVLLEKAREVNRKSNSKRKNTEKRRLSRLKYGRSEKGRLRNIRYYWNHRNLSQEDMWKFFLNVYK